MTSPLELFESGQLSDAVTAATENVRNNPSDLPARSLLSELLCFSGDFERADKQLEAATKIDPDAMVGASLLRHLIRSELCRREVFEQGRVPEFLAQPTEAQQNRLKALVSLREGDPKAASEFLSAAGELEQSISGVIDGQPFDEICDLDDILGPTLEIYTATGKYYWLSFEQVISLEFSAVEHLSDMLWRAAEIETIGDVSGRIHVPALYFGSHLSEDQKVRIGRATDWVQAGEDEPTRGSGMREWLVGEEVTTLIQVKYLQLTQESE